MPAISKLSYFLLLGLTNTDSGLLAEQPRRGRGRHIDSLKTAGVCRPVSEWSSDDDIRPMRSLICSFGAFGWTSSERGLQQRSCTVVMEGWCSWGMGEVFDKVQVL